MKVPVLPVLCLAAALAFTAAGQPLIAAVVVGYVLGRLR